MFIFNILYSLYIVIWLRTLVTGNVEVNSDLYSFVGVEKGKLRGCVNDFLLRRHNNILLVKDIMRG